MSRTVLVTGASRGLGRQIAEHFLAQGHQVFGCARSESDLRHPNYLHHCVDVSSEPSVKEYFFSLRKHTRSLDMLINNAGIASMNAFALTPEKSAQQVFDINVFGTIHFCQKALGLLRKSEHGRIVNFTTVAVPLQLEGEAIYAASKSAVETLTKIIAKEYASFGITCNAVGPSPIDTALIKSVPEKKIDALIARQAIKRKADAKDVINIVDFFCQPSSAMVTGQILYLGGIS